MIRPVEIYRNVPPHDPSVPRPVHASRVTFADLAAEGEERRPHRILQPAVGDHHVEDRLRLAGDGLPHTDSLKQPPRRRGNRM